MTHDDLDLLTETALHDLDAAPDTDLTPAQSERMDLTLERIVGGPAAAGDAPGAPAATLPAATAPVVPTAPTPLPTRRRPGRARRVLLGVGAVAASTVGLLVLQNVTAGDTAYATWTAQPSAVTSAEDQEIGEACRAYLGDMFRSSMWDQNATAGVPESDIPQASDLANATVTVAEQRGDWRFALLTGPSGFEGTCMLQRLGLLSRVFGQDYGTATGMVTLNTAPAPAADTVSVTNLASMTSDVGSYVELSGQAGDQVRAISIDSPKGPVEATVNGGHFAAWWPADAPDPGGARVEVSPETGPWTLTLTLADGTTRQVSTKDVQTMPTPEG
jgi:hypothetical protein